MQFSEVRPIKIFKKYKVYCIVPHNAYFDRSELTTSVIVVNEN